MIEKSLTQEQKNARGVLVAGVLILLVGGFFVAKTFWKNTSEEKREDTSSISPEQKAQDIPLITAEAVRQKIFNNERITILDVRNQESFDAEHIPHSFLTSSGALNTYTAGADEVVVVVLSNADTQIKEAVGNILKQKSYPVFILKEGFEGWKKAGNQVLSRGDPNSFLDQSKITYITKEEAKKALNDTDARYFILDVQTAQNYQNKHMKGAVNIPLAELEKRSKEIPSGRNILVYGESEFTSFQGGVRLADLNIFTARTLAGNDHLKPESGFILEP